MGIARLVVYLVGLALVVTAAWIFLTQTPLGQAIPSGVAVAIILLLVGIGVMMSARSINDSVHTRRVVHDAAYAPPAYGPPVAGGYAGRVYDTRDLPPQPVAGETVVEERRFD